VNFQFCRSISFSFFSVAAVVAISLLESASLAQGESCAHLFANADFRNEIKSSETHRRLMLNYAHQMQLELRSQMKARNATFERAVRLRNGVRDNDIQRVIETSEMLSQFDLSALQSGPANGRLKPPMIDMEKPLDVGYFEWLKHNSLELKLVDEGQLFQDGAYRPTMTQVEPLDLLRRYIEENLPLDLALKLVQAKLDPTLPEDAREAAVSLRRLTALDKALDQNILPYLGVRFSNSAVHEAWSLFTSPSEARTALMNLLEVQVKTHGARFARNDFERLARAMHERPGQFTPMVRFLEMSAKGDLTPAQVADVGSFLGVMKATLRLNPDIDLGDLSRVVGRLLPSPLSYSYEGLLADTFSPLGSGVPDQIRSLRKLIEISDAMKTREALVTYVETYIPPSRTP